MDCAESDDELMRAYAGGDQAAFARLYDRYRGPLYRYFRRQLAPDQADDCFQSLWLKVIGHARRYRPSGAFDHYLYTLAHNVLMDHYRKDQPLRQWLRPARRQITTDGAAVTAMDGVDGHAIPEQVDGAPGPDAIAAHHELRQRLGDLLQRLPFHQREAWILKQEAALSAEDIAVITGTSIEGVRSRLRYATSKLKAGLARHV